MENFIIQGQKDLYFIPEINFDAASGECILSGESYVEDAIKFYIPVLKWIEDYISEVKGPLNFNIGLSYFNTSSSRSITEILMLLKDYEDKGGNVTVSWTVFDDEDLVEEIEDLSLLTELEINIIEAEKSQE